MRSNWRYRLAGLIAAAAIVAGPAQLLIGPAGHALAASEQDCPQGTHWDTILQQCV